MSTALFLFVYDPIISPFFQFPRSHFFLHLPKERSRSYLKSFVSCHKSFSKVFFSPLILCSSLFLAEHWIFYRSSGLFFFSISLLISKMLGFYLSLAFLLETGWVLSSFLRSLFVGKISCPSGWRMQPVQWSGCPTGTKAMGITKEEFFASVFYIFNEVAVLCDTW